MKIAHPFSEDGRNIRLLFMFQEGFFSLQTGDALRCIIKKRA